MKKFNLVAVLASIALIGACASPAFAASRTSCNLKRGCTELSRYCQAYKANCWFGTGQGQNWVDEDNDGVCDNALTDQGARWVDENGDGMCDNAEALGGRNWVDTDNDGVCDNRNANSKNRGSGLSAGGYGAHGKGWKAGY